MSGVHFVRLKVLVPKSSILRDLSKMYSTQAIAKLEKNGKYEKITIGRGWTSEDDLDIDIKVKFMSPIAELTWVSTKG